MKFGHKVMKLIATVGMLVILGTIPTYATEPAQSNRWEGSGDTWKVKTADGTGYLANSWFQDADSSWYMLGEDGTMYSGIVTDQSTNKSYLLNPNHDGTFGKMLTQDGTYNINGQTLYLTFNQSHDGTYGAILTGLSELRDSGIAEQSLLSVPSDSSGISSNTQETQSHGLTNNGISEEDRQRYERNMKDASQKLTVDPNANRGMRLHN